MYLNCHSVFSFRYGTLTEKQLINTAKKLGFKTIALTDINNTSACIPFIQQAKRHNIKPVVGIDFRQKFNKNYVGLAKNEEGFYRLNTFLSSVLNESISLPAYAPQLKDTFFIYPFCKYHNHFFELKSNEFIGISREELKKLPFSAWKHHSNKLVFLQSVTIHKQQEYNIHRLLRAIDKNTLLSKLSEDDFCLKSDRMYPKQELDEILLPYPELVKNTEHVLDNCSICFDFKGNKKSGTINQNKAHFFKNEEEDNQKIKELCLTNLEYRYPGKREKKAIKQRLEKEINLIREQGFASYFLINWDMLRFARKQGFYYVGRGSGANSVVAYLLQITNVDPIKLDLYFERFINPYRNSPPDFDIDFSWKDRDVITKYLFDKYGTKNQIALLATYNSFTKKSLLRELGKVFGLPKNDIDTLHFNNQYNNSTDKYHNLIYKYANLMNGIPSHLSVHAGGILIAEKSIHYYSATTIPPKGYPLVQFDMIHAEDVGLYKFDILSQRGLGKIKDTVELLVSRGKALDLDIHNTNRFFTDEKVVSLLKNGETLGCFYVESPAMRMLFKKLKATTYLGLVAASSIIRPGVAKSGMMREYILRSQGKNKNWRETTPKIMQDLLEETYGVMVYQEDVIKVAHYFAGLSLGEADVLRRGMSGKFRSRDEFDKVRQKFFDNCLEKGYKSSLTKEVWRQIESFAGYAFSKGHSASYAVESYQSLYLRAHYPMEFIVGVINNGGGFYRTETYFREARKLGANLLAPCINHSSYLTTLHKENDVYLGFGLIFEFEQKLAKQITKERLEGGYFTDLADFINRLLISKQQLTLLIRVGSFRFTQKTKQELLWEMHNLFGRNQKSTNSANLFQTVVKKYSLPPLEHTPNEKIYDEIELLGFSLSSPFKMLQDLPLKTVMAKSLLSFKNKEVEVLGNLVTIKNTRTANKEYMHFGTFLDANGDWVDTVHFPAIAKKYPFRGKGCYLIRGVVKVEFDYPTVEVNFLKQIPQKERF